MAEPTAPETTETPGTDAIPGSSTDGPKPAEAPKATAKKAKGKAPEPSVMNLPDGTIRIDH